MRLTTALEILRIIADRNNPLEPMSVGSLAQLVDTSASSASRICAELEKVHLIDHGTGYGAYRIGARAIQISGSAAAPFSVAVDFALTLGYQATGETVALVAESPGAAAVIGVVQSARTLHVASTVGDLMANPESAACQALRSPSASSIQPVVVSSGLGVVAEVATPVRDPHGQCLAALVVRYPGHRGEQVTALAQRAVVTARAQLEKSIRKAVADPVTEDVPATRPEGRSTIRAAVDVLETLRGPTPTPVADIARLSGLRADRVRRLLEACDAADIASFSVEDDTARLHWSVHGWHRGIVDATLRGPGRQLVAAVSGRAASTAYLTVRRGMRSLTMAESIVDGALKMSPWLGRPAQLIGSDGGPVLVKHFDDTQIRQVFPSRITKTAKGTPKDLEAFLIEVRRARAEHTLVLPDFGEDGLTSVAAPVRDASGVVVAAACIVGPGRDLAQRISTIKLLAAELAADVSRLLHCPGGGADDG